MKKVLVLAMLILCSTFFVGKAEAKNVTSNNVVASNSQNRNQMRRMRHHRHHRHHRRMMRRMRRNN